MGMTEEVRKRRFTGNGKIKPGAHPEFDKPKPFGNPVKQISGAVKRGVAAVKSKVGSKRRGSK